MPKNATNENHIHRRVTVRQYYYIFIIEMKWYKSPRKAWRKTKSYVLFINPKRNDINRVSNNLTLILILPMVADHDEWA